MPTKKKSGGARKYGRSKPACEKYRQMNTRERNKSRKLAKHLKKWPQDSCAKKALRKLIREFPQFEKGVRHVLSTG